MIRIASSPDNICHNDLLHELEILCEHPFYEDGRQQRELILRNAHH